MALVSPYPPESTPEYDALTPRDGERGQDALARVGEEIAQEFRGDDQRDSRKNKKMPRMLAALVLLRAQGFDNREIADRLQVSTSTLKKLITKARREYGWNDLGERLVNVALPQAVENVEKHLEYEGTEAAIRADQSTMTREITKGLGIFKTHAAVKSETKQTKIQVLKVEVTLPQLPPGDPGMAAISAGSVLAAPRRAQLVASHPTPAAIDAEVVDAEIS